MIWLRNLAFYVAFYAGSVLFTLSAFLARPFSKRLFESSVHGWSRFHRICVTNLLGCEIVTEGRIPDDPVFFAIKHESFFEAIDTPALLRWPAVFAKQELFAIPHLGRGRSQLWPDRGPARSWRRRAAQNDPRGARRHGDGAPAGDLP